VSGDEDDPVLVALRNAIDPSHRDYDPKVDEQVIEVGRSVVEAETRKRWEKMTRWEVFVALYFPRFWRGAKCAECGVCLPKADPRCCIHPVS
jgi:hypothetical protein